MNLYRPVRFITAVGQSPTARSNAGFRRTIVIVTMILWASNYVVLNSRDLLSDSGLEADVALMRAGLTGLGIALCYVIHLVIRRLAGKPFRHKTIAVAILTPIAAEIFTWLNTFGLNLVAPERTATTPPIGSIIFSLAYCVLFFMAWSAFYLALDYSQEARAQERRAAAIQANAQAAQLRALRFQINPHFLFNTLNSIAALIGDNHSRQAELMVTRLAAFFRSSLSADPLEDVRLSEEIAAQQLYLEIEQVRFPDLSVSIDIPDELCGALVPSLILQPLVENAVKYGVAHSPCPAQIRLWAGRDNDWLLLEVSDDGSGAHGAFPCGAGIGLSNVRERLVRRFGDCCRFQAGPILPRGFRVRIAMPLSFAS